MVMPVVESVLLSLRSLVRSRAALHLEMLALRHWVWFSLIWTDWRPALIFLKPDTVVAWHRRGCRLFWTWKSGHRAGRPTVPLTSAC
jgi:hypothetical protein